MCACHWYVCVRWRTESALNNREFVSHSSNGRRRSGRAFSRGLLIGGWAHPRVRSLHGPCLPAQDRLTTNMWRWVWDVLPRVRRDMYPWKSPNLANYTRVKEARA